MRRGVQFVALQERGVLGGHEPFAGDVERALLHELPLHRGERDDAHVRPRLRPLGEAGVGLAERVLGGHLHARQHLAHRARHVGDVADEHRHVERLEFLQAELELGQALRLVLERAALGRVVAVAVPEEEIEGDHAVGRELLRARGRAGAVADGRHEEESARQVAREQPELGAREAHHVDEPETAGVLAVVTRLAEHAAEPRGRTRADDGDADRLLGGRCVGRGGRGRWRGGGGRWRGGGGHRRGGGGHRRGGRGHRRGLDARMRDRRRQEHRDAAEARAQETHGCGTHRTHVPTIRARTRSSRDHTRARRFCDRPRPGRRCP